MSSLFRSIPAAIILATLGLVAGCHSRHVDATVENRTGAAIELLEVDYPYASFGADSLAPGASFHYRFQLRGSGNIKVQYTAAAGRQFQIEGPLLTERQEGRMGIVLLPQGRAEFHPEITSAP